MILMCVQSIVGVIIQVGHFGFHHKPNAFIVFRPVWQALSLPSLWCQWAGARPSCSPRSVPSLQSPYCTTAWILQNALITMRNGALYLLVRLADLRMKHLIECHVNGHFLMKVGQFKLPICCLCDQRWLQRRVKRFQTIWAMWTLAGKKCWFALENWHKNICSSLEGYLTEGPGPSDYIQVHAWKCLTITILGPHLENPNGDPGCPMGTFDMTLCVLV